MATFTPTPEPDVDAPLSATANGPSVVISGVRNVAVAMTPEAVLASLEPLRRAAEDAVRNRDAGVPLDHRDGLD
jgi:hypothetical protein